MDSFLATHRRARPSTSAFAISALVHILVALALITGRLRLEIPPISGDVAAIPSHLVWFSQDGPGGGGGGGGYRRSEPARQLQMRGSDRTNVPALQRTLTQTVESTVAPPPIRLDVPVRAFADSDLLMAGVLESAPFSSSQGPGDRGGAGSGDGPGIGPGDGPGLGPGRNGGMGNGVWGIGSGVRPPVPTHQEKPQYTHEAMRARIEGAVLVECVVQPNGIPTNVRVVRSLDRRFGLDQQALQAATLWRFAPATLLGKPVPMLVTIQIGFSIH